jgi:H+/Cl- antiporter ClcA
VTLRTNEISELSKVIALLIMVAAFIVPTFLAHTYLSLTGDYGNLVSDRIQLLTDAIKLSYHIYLAFILCALAGFLIRFYLINQKKKDIKQR